MPAPIVGAAATAIADDVFPVSYLSQSAIPGGAVVCYNAGGTAPNNNDEVVLPGAVNAGQIAGVSRSFGPYTSGAGGASTAGVDRVRVQKVGRAPVLLAAGQTCNVGDIAVVANASGHVQSRTRWTGSAGKIGKFAQAKTAGANPELVEVDLELGDVEYAMLISGFASTTSQNNTRYLSAPGTGAPSATAIELAVVPPGGGTLRNLVASDGTAPGGTDSDTFTVYRNPLVAGAYTGWAATALTCAVTGSAVEAKDSTHSVAVNEGDLLAIAVVASATSLGASRRASMQLT